MASEFLEIDVEKFAKGPGIVRELSVLKSKERIIVLSSEVVSILESNIFQGEIIPTIVIMCRNGRLIEVLFKNSALLRDLIYEDLCKKWKE